MFYNERLAYFAGHSLVKKPIPNGDWLARLMFKDFEELPELRDKTKKDRNAYLRELKRANEDWELIQRTGYDSEGNRFYRVTESVSKSPSAAYSAYEVNETFAEMRTPFDEWRGLITTTLFAFLAAPVFVGIPELIMSTIPGLLTGVIVETGEPLSSAGYAYKIFNLLVVVAWIGIAVRYGHPVFRLETFVQRRLLVRFNRRNKKVYLHRPRYAGGVIELPWEKVIVGINNDGNEAAGIGLPLVLMWNPEDSPNGVPETVLVGRRAHGNSEIINLWEYIRRYMQSDPSQPHGLPKTKRKVGKFPWPWKPVLGALSLISPLFRMGTLRWMLPLVVLISPAIALFAVAQWVSYWLCWEPRWPKQIREACGDGPMDTMKLWLIDLGTWAMAGGTLWWWFSH